MSLKTRSSEKYLIEKVAFEGLFSVTNELNTLDFWHHFQQW